MGRGGWAVLKGARASGVMTQGEMLVWKFLARKGPRGWDSQDWMSRADQSLRRQKPAMWLAASAMGMGAPGWLPGPIQMPISSS